MERAASVVAWLPQPRRLLLNVKAPQSRIRQAPHTSFTRAKIAEALKVPVEYLLSTESDCAHHWVSVKVRLPELDEDEPFARCIVNVIRWCEGWTGPWNQPEPTLNKEEFTAAATYNPEQKIFTVYDGFGGQMAINALLSPDDCGNESGCRVTHWMEHPAPVGFWEMEG